MLLRDHYRAIQPLGQGGFGRTFLAVDEDRRQGRCVIKQFFPQSQCPNTTQKAAELFEQEAARLDELGKHPQIPQLLAHFEQDHFQYLVQEFIEGQNLDRELAEQGAFDERKIRQLLLDLLPVLQVCHSRGVIHRDIKPENIIRRSAKATTCDAAVAAQLVLVDFGAAKVLTGEERLQKGTAIGTPEYMAPEQIHGQATFASDLYNLGVTCIHLLTQMPPLELRNPSEDAWMWRQYLKRPISEGLAKILDKMLQRATSQRYQSATEVLQDLNSLINSLSDAIESLHLNNKFFIAQQIYDSDCLTTASEKKLTEDIYEFLATCARAELKREKITEWQIISLWRNYLVEIVEKMPVNLGSRDDKIFFLEKLRGLGNDCQIGKNLRSLVKETAVLMYNAFDEKEKEEFWEKVREDLKNDRVNLAEEQLKKAGIKGILFGTAGLPALLVPVVSRIILRRITRGLLTGILIHVLGRRALSRAVLGFMGGPIGVGINVALAAGGVIHGVSSYQKEKRKAKFIQAIFSIYLLSN